MKLFYMPNACSLGIHIILEEIGSAYELVKIDFGKQQQYSDSYRALNPKSKVPSLELDKGGMLTEWPAIAFYLAKQYPEKNLLPEVPLAQARVLETIDYVISTMHMQGFARIFRPGNFAFGAAHHEAVKEKGRGIVENGLGIIESMGAPFVADDYSIADAALFYAELWATKRASIGLPEKCARHYARMLERPAVRRALEQEQITV